MICRLGPGVTQKCLYLLCVPNEGRVMEVEMARRLISLLLTHGLFLLAGDRVSNSISQVFIYYFPFQSWGNFFS